MDVSNQKIMWAVSAVILLFSSYLGYTSFHTQSLPDLDSVKEWDGDLPDYEEMGGQLSGEKGTWVKSKFILNEGVLGEFDCYGVSFGERDPRELVEVEQDSYNVTIIWDDPDSDEYMFTIEGWVDVHQEIEFYGTSNDECNSGTLRKITKPYPIGAEEEPVGLRGLFLILEGSDGMEDWYLVSIGYDETGGFGVEPSVDTNKLSRGLWSAFWGAIGLFVLYSSFDSRNK